MKDIAAALIGFGLAMFLSGILGMVSSASSLKSFRNEAVSAGDAEWIISTDSNGSPALEFRWKQSK